MAERRMFAKTIVMSDAFLDMPPSTRCLYFALGMVADDDGFVNSPRSVMRQAGATLDDLNVLTAKKFIIPFDSGVVVIKHWKVNNYIRNDRYSETKYRDEKASLSLDENGAYTLGIPHGIPTVDKRYTQDRIGKDSLGFLPYSSRVRAEKAEDVEIVENAENRNTEVTLNSFVHLSEEEVNDLLCHLTIEDFDYYVSVIETCEKNGKGYRKKTHYQAILDMAMEDRKLTGGTK